MLHLPLRVKQYGKEILISHNREIQEFIEKEVKNGLYELAKANSLCIQDMQLSVISCADPGMLSSSWRTEIKWKVRLSALQSLNPLLISACCCTSTHDLLQSLPAANCPSSSTAAAPSPSEERQVSGAR